MQEAADTAERIMEAVAQPLSLARQGADASTAAWASRCSTSDDAADADELIRDADAAMYIAKRDGKGGYRLFEPEMHDGVMARLELRADLQRALAPASSSSSTSRSSASPTARSSASRRCCAGATPSAAWSTPTTSSRSPRRPA